MKKILTLLLLIVSLNLLSQNYFSKDSLMSVGVYYYPEHWNQDQWERDLKNIAGYGFEFIHMAEFSWVLLEPSEGVYDFKWLDKAVELAGKYKLKVILGTPTACAPVWLGKKYPEIYLMDQSYTRKQHGTRANFSLSNEKVIDYSKKIVAEMAKHYGENKNVIGWQLDNEPEAKEDYSLSATNAFRIWLKDKYKSVSLLNYAWGNTFWSQLYKSFDEIDIPNAALVGWWGTNPIALLDFKRFSAVVQADFLDMQAKELRKYISENQFITTNYVAKVTQADPTLTNHLDFSSYTAYPNYGSSNLGELGFRLGDYKVLMYANDYYRSIGKTTGVMELQPGPVNWANYNPLLQPGTVRMWLWHCFGGGCSFACTYRYRQILYGAEQFHSGIVLTDGVSLTEGGKGFVQVVKELNLLRQNYKSNRKVPALLEKRRTAIMWSHDNYWSLEHQKQSVSWDTWEHMHKYHRILKSLGAPVDFIEEKDDFNKYPFIVVPAYQLVDSALVKKWQEYVCQGGNLIISCRTGAKDKNGHFWESNISGIMNELIGGNIESIDMLPPYKQGQIEMSGSLFKWTTWGEQITPKNNTLVMAKYNDQFYQSAACCLNNKTGKGNVWYIGVDSKDGALEKEIIKKAYNTNGIDTENYPEGVLVYWRDGFMIAVNYSSEKYVLKPEKNARFLIGDEELNPADVAIWIY